MAAVAHGAVQMHGSSHAADQNAGPPPTFVACQGRPHAHGRKLGPALVVPRLQARAGKGIHGMIQVCRELCTIHQPWKPPHLPTSCPPHRPPGCTSSPPTTHLEASAGGQVLARLPVQHLLTRHLRPLAGGGGGVGVGRLACAAAGGAAEWVAGIEPNIARHFLVTGETLSQSTVKQLS